MTENPSGSKGIRQLITFDELCEITKMSKSTMYHLLSEGKGPASMKIGRSLRFSPKKVEDWLDGLEAARELPPFSR